MSLYTKRSHNETIAGQNELLTQVEITRGSFNKQMIINSIQGDTLKGVENLFDKKSLENFNIDDELNWIKQF